jgi:hypothetical protein
VAKVSIERRDGKKATADFPFLQDGTAEGITDSMGDEWADQAVVEKGYAFARNFLTNCINRDMTPSEITKAAAEARPGTRRTKTDAVLAKLDTMTPDELAAIQERLSAALKAQGGQKAA